VAAEEHDHGHGHGHGGIMIPLSDGIPARRFPFVNVTLIAANFAVFLFYELPNGDAAVNRLFRLDGGLV
jgi:hypothetical protein